MFTRGYRWADVYPGFNMPGTDPSAQSFTNAASSPSLAPNISPAHVLIAIIVLLVLIRVVSDLAPIKAVLK